MGYLGNTPTTQSFTSGTDYFNGTGSQTAFTLSRSVNSVNDIQVTVNNVVQQPNDAYTVSGTTLTMTSAPSSGTNNVYVRYLSTTTQTIAPSSGVALSAALGTASSPSYSFAGDSNTGIFSPAADTIAFAEGGTEVARIDSSGNLGIGTSSPAGRLHVQNSAGTHTQIWGATGAAGSYAYMRLQRNTSDGTFTFGTAQNSYSSIAFATSNGADEQFSERMRITSAGSLCINTPSVPVFGNEKLAVQSTTDEVVSFTSGGGAAKWCLGLWNKATSGTRNQVLFYDSNPAVVCGSITTNGSNTTYATSSDYRLKENILPMTGALNTVSALRPVTYTWKATNKSAQGFIAHELAEVLPDAVVGEKDAVNEDGSIKPQGIDTSYLVATLTAAIQELNEKVEAQAAEIAALKGANNAS